MLLPLFPSYTVARETAHEFTGSKTRKQRIVWSSQLHLRAFIPGKNQLHSISALTKSSWSEL